MQRPRGRNEFGCSWNRGLSGSYHKELKLRGRRQIVKNLLGLERRLDCILRAMGDGRRTGAGV